MEVVLADLNPLSCLASWITSRRRGSYRVAEVAHYLRMPKATVRAWAVGQGKFDRVLTLEPREGVPHLSFVNVIEVHVLHAFRREHDIPLRKARRVLRLLSQLFPASAHALAGHDLLIDGGEVFVGTWAAWCRPLVRSRSRCAICWRRTSQGGARPDGTSLQAVSLHAQARGRGSHS